MTFVYSYPLIYIITAKDSKKAMLKDKILTPKNFLKSPQEYQKYACWICYQLCIKPVKCKGTCGHIFCMKCVSDTRNNNQDRCPSRCSSPFLVTPLPQLSLDFHCPYNSSQCQQPITSISIFHNHYQVCPFISPQQLSHKKLQQSYKCLNDHHLQFYIGSYQQMINLYCCQCGQQKICRSICRICEQFYCVSCRVPPCSKKECPIGHQFKFQRIGVINYLCDVCGISTAISNGGVYDDSCCNFGICELCFQELPQKYDQSKPRAIVKNVNTQCSCGKKLGQYNELNRMKTCQLCRKETECPKYCSNCDKHFCINCKTFDIFSDQTCSLDHQLTKVPSPSPLHPQQQTSCMRCHSQSSPSYYSDPLCHVTLCQPCLLYFTKITTDKQRPISLPCQKNHILNYITGQQSYQDICCLCHKNKIIKLACIHCEEDQNMYCFQCRRIPLKTCYFQHKMRFQKFQKKKECQVCGGRGKEMVWCRKCAFYACQGCVQLSMNGEKMENEGEERGEKMEVEAAS